MWCAAEPDGAAADAAATTEDEMTVMCFTGCEEHQAKIALQMCDNNTQYAVNWWFTHGPMGNNDWDAYAAQQWEQDASNTLLEPGRPLQELKLSNVERLRVRPAKVKTVAAVAGRSGASKVNVSFLRLFPSCPRHIFLP